MVRLIKKIGIIFLVCMTHVIQAQNVSSIVPLFAIDEDNGSLSALNQITGDKFSFENDLSFNPYGKNYAFSIDSNVCYFISDDPTNNNQSILYTLYLPESYEDTIIEESDTLPINIDDIVYNSDLNRLYLFTANSQVYYSYNLPFNQIGGPFTITNFTQIDPNSVGLAMSGINLFASGNLLGNPETIGLQRINVFNTFSIDSQFVDYQNIILSNTNPASTNVFAIIEDTGNVFYSAVIDSLLNIQILDTLPSCPGCVNESYQYPKNSITYDFDNNQFIVLLEKTISGITSRELLTIDENTGSVGKQIPLTSNFRNLIYVQVNKNIVFPGDANHDGIVDMKDALAIGLQYNTTLTPRISPILNWVGQSAIDLGSTFINNQDVKHADCNGDGQINIIDTASILNNFKSIHNGGQALPNNSGSCDIPIYFTLVDSVIYENEIELQIGLGSDLNIAADVYGVSFTISYDTSIISSNGVQTEGIDSWFGFSGQDYFKLAKNEYSTGQLSIGVSGFDHQNRSGSGNIVTSIWGVEDEVIPIAQPVDINFQISDIYLIGYDESVKEVCNIDTTFTITKKSVGVRELENNFFDVYPNPTNGKVKIQSSEEIEKVSIISLSGVVIEEYLWTKRELDLNHLSAGIYFIKASSSFKTGIRKIIIQ